MGTIEESPFAVTVAVSNSRIAPFAWISVVTLKLVVVGARLTTCFKTGLTDDKSKGVPL